MNQQEDPTLDAPADEIHDTGNTTTRADEQGDAAEPNAPTRVNENSGMNTILDGGWGTGIQMDESDE